MNKVVETREENQEDNIEKLSVSTSKRLDQSPNPSLNFEFSDKVMSNKVTDQVVGVQNAILLVQLVSEDFIPNFSK